MFADTLMKPFPWLCGMMYKYTIQQIILRMNDLLVSAGFGTIVVPCRRLRLFKRGGTRGHAARENSLNFSV